ncbi:molybdopterin synthase subunit MoaD [Hydrogenivirga caldilitoris]|uniref:Molybdopterin synthase sulfur carrier subunit n=1 Tax=Hydrogenivirga caldilitoris TaxID=246264 RepID=A0A497XQC5_9AQUI|nr:molybdopterin converting factor subunit 1 [Hydrogenivirga caldilitoris]RLJ70481.1 molybdopterin synthase subunit MoaD [Hydrogenivirga caldilitoris]
MPRVIYFSVLKEKLGISEEELDFRGSVAKLREVLKERHPEAAEIIDRVKFAVNEEYVSEDYRIEGDERIAIIPPVSGG